MKVAVITAHLIFLSFILFGTPLTPRKHKPLVVNTVRERLPPQVVTVAATPQPKPAAPKPVAQKKEAAIADKKVTKKPVPVKKTAKPENRATISDALLHKLQESIAQIDTPPAAAVKSTKPVIQLQIDQANLSSDYAGTLINYLHQSLHLPEFGEVKIQLTLRQDGTVAKLVVLKAESLKNKSYLETNLPTLRFPRLEGPYAQQAEHAFVLTFCNEV